MIPFAKKQNKSGVRIKGLICDFSTHFLAVLEVVLEKIAPDRFYRYCTGTVHRMRNFPAIRCGNLLVKLDFRYTAT
jgi:hypothetical protein